MLPRKSSVLRYAAGAFVSCALLLIWLSSPGRENRDRETLWMLDEPALLLANDSQLLHQISLLQVGFAHNNTSRYVTATYGYVTSLPILCLRILCFHIVNNRLHGLLLSYLQFHFGGL